MFQIMIFKIPTFILAKLSEKGGKELPLKTEKDRRYAEIAFICMMKNYFYPCNITHKIWRINVQLMKSLMKRLKRSLNTKNCASYAKIVFRFFFSKCLNMTNINALWEKKSKCFDLVPFLTHFESFFAKCVIYPSVCVVTMRLLIKLPWNCIKYI